MEQRSVGIVFVLSTALRSLFVVFGPGFVAHDLPRHVGRRAGLLWFVLATAPSACAFSSSDSHFPGDNRMFPFTGKNLLFYLV